MSKKKNIKKNIKKNKNTTLTEKIKALPPYLLVLGAVCIVMAIVTAVVSIVVANRDPIVEFIPPSFEADAVVGAPEDVPENAGYTKIYREGMTFSAYLCGGVTQENGEAVVYFTSPEDNEAWIKLRICDEDGNILGESGLLRPGEYVRSVTLTEPVAAGTPLKMKLMAYEPDTYFSLGSVTITTAMMN